MSKKTCPHLATESEKKLPLTGGSLEHNQTRVL